MNGALFSKIKRIYTVIRRLSDTLLLSINAREEVLCVWLHKASRAAWVKHFFIFISWLGDGKFWYAIALIILIMHQRTGVLPAVHLVALGLVGVALYRFLKGVLVRERPYVSIDSIVNVAKPLDRYSFPSGHSLHAVSFTVVILAYYPAFFWLVVPFTVLVALSRMILGLHYPSDVIVGGLLGWMLALASFTVVNMIMTLI